MADRRRFEALDSFRGVCALLVAFMHLPALHSFYFSPFLRGSYLFVDFFFVLSGWVISYSYSTRLDNRNNVLAFMVRRLGRVWPLHMVVLGVFILVQLASLVAEKHVGGNLPKPAFTGNWAASAIPLHILLVQALFQPRMGTWNLPSWSISVEFWTYLIFALTILATRGRWIIGISIAFVISGLAVVWLFGARGMDVTFDIGLFRCVAGFFIGLMIQRLWSARSRRADAHPGIWTGLEILVLVGAVAFISIVGYTKWSIAAPFVFAAVVYVFAYERGLVSTLMKTPAMLRIGLWSYSIYMVHAVYASIIFRNLPRILGPMLHQSVSRSFEFEGETKVVMVLPHQWETNLAAVCYLAAIIGTAALSYRYIEVPAREWFSRRAARIGGPRREPEAAKEAAF